MSLVWIALTLSGCLAYTSHEPPRHTPVLPLERPVWSTLEVEGADADAGHDQVIFDVVSATGVCDEGLTSNPDAWSLKLVLDSQARTSPVTEFLCGLTMTTVPAFQWYDLTLRGALVDSAGEVKLAAAGQSTVGVAMSWLFLFVPPLLSDSDATAKTSEHVRKLTRYVISELVGKYENVRARRPEPEAGNVVLRGSERNREQ